MTTATLHAATLTQFSRKKRLTIAVPLVILAYFAYIFVSFDVAGLGGWICLNTALTQVSDI